MIHHHDTHIRIKKLFHEKMTWRLSQHKTNKKTDPELLYE